MNTNQKQEPDCSSSSVQRKTIFNKKNPRRQNVALKRKFETANSSSSDVSREERQIFDKLSCIQHPLIDLPPIKYTNKFLGRYRLFVGNLPSDLSENEFVDLFKQFGEVSDSFLQANRGFGFIRVDYLHNTLKAKESLTNFNLRNRRISVRLSPFASLIVLNLPQFATNELLHIAFSVFGEIEFCTIIVDTKGKSLKKGIVDFKLKKCANLAKKYCSEQPFLLSNCLKPVIVKDYEIIEDDCGLSEEVFNNRNKPTEYYKEREVGPRFAKNRFEYEYSSEFKNLYERYEMQKAKLEEEFKEAEKQLEANARKAQFDHETEQLKEILRQREIEMHRWMNNDPPMQMNRRNNDVSDVLFQGAHKLNHILSTQEQKLEEEGQGSKINTSFESYEYERNCNPKINIGFNQTDFRKRKKLNESY